MTPLFLISFWILQFLIGIQIGLFFSLLVVKFDCVWFYAVSLTIVLSILLSRYPPTFCFSSAFRAPVYYPDVLRLLLSTLKDITPLPYGVKLFLYAQQLTFFAQFPSMAFCLFVLFFDRLKANFWEMSELNFFSLRVLNIMSFLLFLFYSPRKENLLSSFF